MKYNILNVSVMAIMCITFTIPSFSQTTSINTTEKVEQKPATIEKTTVSKAVTEKFDMEHPSVMKQVWYGYPNYDFYNDWYGYNPYLFEYVNPEFYIVEYTKEGVNHKAVYFKDGTKIAVHKKTTASLPKVIADAIKKSSYSSWRIAKEKEEIFKDTKLDKMKVYKIEVAKGIEKHQLYYSTEGTLLIDKTIKI